MVEPTKPPVTPEQQAEFDARRRKRSIALGLALGALVIIFYVLTMVKLGPAVFDRAL